MKTQREFAAEGEKRRLEKFTRHFHHRMSADPGLARTFIRALLSPPSVRDAAVSLEGFITQHHLDGTLLRQILVEESSIPPAKP